MLPLDFPPFAVTSHLHAMFPSDSWQGSLFTSAQINSTVCGGDSSRSRKTAENTGDRYDSNHDAGYCSMCSLNDPTFKLSSDFACRVWDSGKNRPICEEQYSIGAFHRF